MKEQNNKDEALLSDAKQSSKDRKTVIRVLCTVALSVIVFTFYRFSLAVDFFFPIVMWSYMAILAVLVFVYIIYNRGFSRKGVTVDMLPEEWSEEKKQDFVADARRRLKRSKWMLIFIIAFLVTFLMEALELFVLPMFSSWF